MNRSQIQITVPSGTTALKLGISGEEYFKMEYFEILYVAY